ncbi:MAG: hypothetical protein FJ224_12425 [Lentisphaerae bacterium]|nr:hypothetical protein [Lentisphaerota bacterium]
MKAKTEAAGGEISFIAGYALLHSATSSSPNPAVAAFGLRHLSRSGLMPSGVSGEFFAGTDLSRRVFERADRDLDIRDMNCGCPDGRNTDHSIR